MQRRTAIVKRHWAHLTASLIGLVCLAACGFQVPTVQPTGTSTGGPEVAVQQGLQSWATRNGLRYRNPALRIGVSSEDFANVEVTAEFPVRVADSSFQEQRAFVQVRRVNAIWQPPTTFDFQLAPRVVRTQQADRLATATAQFLGVRATNTAFSEANQTAVAAQYVTATALTQGRSATATAANLAQSSTATVGAQSRAATATASTQAQQAAAASATQNAVSTATARAVATPTTTPLAAATPTNVPVVLSPSPVLTVVPSSNPSPATAPTSVVTPLPAPTSAAPVAPTSAPAPAGSAPVTTPPVASSAILQSLRSLPGTSSGVFIDLTGGQATTVDDPDRVFPAAALIMLPIVGAAYQQVADGRWRGGDLFTLKESDKVGGTGILQNRTAGSKFTLDELVELTLLHSDNTGANMLVEQLGGFEAVNTFSRANGLANTVMRRKLADLAAQQRGVDNTTTAGDVARYFTRLDEGKIANATLARRILDALRKRGESDKAWALQNLPPSVAAAHITGIGGGLRNEVVHVTTNQQRYILVLLVKDANEQSMEAAITRVSAEIYRLITGR